MFSRNLVVAVCMRTSGQAQGDKTVFCCRTLNLEVLLTEMVV